MPDIKISLLPVSAFEKRDIAVLLVPEKFMLIDLLDNNRIIVYARHRDEGLFYISDLQDGKNPVDWDSDVETVQSMMENSNGTARQSDTETDTSDNEDNDYS